MIATVLTSATALAVIPAVIRAVFTGIVAITAARSKYSRRRQDAQRTLEILLPSDPDKKPSRRGRGRTTGVQRPVPGKE